MRHRITAHEGFTLIELMVVVTIISVLSSIALPSFISQRGKAYDANVKTLVRTAMTTVETIKVTDGSYPNDPAELVAVEGSLSEADGLTAAGTATTFRVSVDSADGERTFWAERLADGSTQLGCAPGGRGGCPKSGSWR